MRCHQLTPATDRVDAASASVLRSMTAFTSLVQAFTAGVATSHGNEARVTAA
ncbi:hypothetical protein [Nocardia sp. NPDC052112]|uniref:hypothetical protein n=1 Tax=Nocardia sp. NPDC052112 TaxID=3155646 RepID=UPI0034238289